MSFPNRKERKIGFSLDGRHEEEGWFAKPPKEYRMELVKSFGRESCFLSYVSRILVYSREEIGFLSGCGQIFLYGKGLKITLYRGGSAEVTGKIEEVKIGRKER